MKTLIATLALLLLAPLHPAARAGTLAHIIIPGIGEVDVELYDQDKPKTVANFTRLINAGAYQNGFFHRCVPGFVLQGGGFFAVSENSATVIGPPYNNLGSAGNFGNVTNEIGVGKFYSNVYGTVAMAKTSDPNSANSQFFFNLADNSASLDNTNNSGGFTVFGHVVRGTNYLNEFNNLSIGENLVDLTQTYGPSAAIFNDLPTFALGTNPPPYYDLISYIIYCPTPVLTLNATNGSKQISWYAVGGVTNNVEFSTNLPPVWQVLTSTYTNTSGYLTTVTDSSPNKTSRFYRLHFLF